MRAENLAQPFRRERRLKRFGSKMTGHVVHVVHQIHLAKFARVVKTQLAPVGKMKDSVIVFVARGVGVHHFESSAHF